MRNLHNLEMLTLFGRLYELINIGILEIGKEAEGPCVACRAKEESRDAAQTSSSINLYFPQKKRNISHSALQ